MSNYPEKQSIISGIGISRVGRRSGIPGIELTTEAACRAIADAGLTMDDIDGIATMGDTPLEKTERALGITARYRGGGYDTGGLLSPAMSAFVAVGNGLARHVLLYRTVLMMGGSILPSENERSKGRPQGRRSARADDPMADAPTLMAYHAYAAPNWIGMHCQRHMHVYGTTKEQLGWLAVESRRKAALNPLAAYRDPMTMDDYMNARPVSSPLGLYDCDVPIDGAIALVVSATDYAKDCPNPPVRVEAIGGAPGTGGWYRRPDYPKMASIEAAGEMWRRTDLKPPDVDIAELYDGFTFLTFAWLEALGLCGDGESGAYVEGGERISLSGELPLNTYGGQLSAGRMHGYWVLYEACLQLRDQAREHQVDGQPEVAVVSNGGGPIAGCMLLTRT